MASIQKTARITLPNGEKKRISARGRTEREAIQKLAKLKAEYEAGILTINGNTTVSRWIGQWLEIYKKPSVTAKTYQQVQSILKRFCVAQIGSISLSQVRKIDLQRCLNEMAAQGYAQRTIKLLYNSITAAITAAVNEGIINSNPSAGLSLPKGTPATSRRSLTPEELTLFQTSIKTNHYGCYFGIMLACGLRPQEARALRYDNIDFVNNTVTISNAFESGTQALKEPKSASGYRCVPLPDWYAQMLSKQPRNISGWVFCTKEGNPINERAHRRAWGWLMRQMDIEAGAVLYRNQVIEHKIDQDISPYYLRHTYCTQLAEHNLDIKTASYLMGHSSIEMTAKYYTHVTQKMLDNARAVINAM